MKIWVDDIRIPEENGYLLARSVNEAKQYIEDQELMYRTSGGKSIYKIDLIDLDHDAGDYAKYGGDFIKLLDWLEETHRNYPIRIHSMNPVGIQNMRRIIERNHWIEVK